MLGRNDVFSLWVEKVILFWQFQHNLVFFLGGLGKRTKLDFTWLLSSGAVHIFCFLVGGFGGGNVKSMLSIYIRRTYVYPYYTFVFFDPSN